MAQALLALLQTKGDDLLGSCRALCRALPGADVCVHYSLKWNYHTNAERSFGAFQQFCADMAALDGKASVMLVSGGGKKRKLDTVGWAPGPFPVHPNAFLPSCEAAWHGPLNMQLGNCLAACQLASLPGPVLPSPADA